MELITLIWGVLALSIGMGLRYWIGKRRFNRRNVAGLEGFSSYGKSIVIPWVERIGKLVAYALIIFGIMWLWIYVDERKRLKEKENPPIEQPVPAHNESD